MAIAYAVFQVVPGSVAAEPLVSGIALSLEAAAKKTASMQFKGLNPEINIIDEVKAYIIVHKPEYARYKVVVLKDRT